MINLKAVQTLILKFTPVLGKESVPILEALGRVLLDDIPALEDLPAFDISAVDGYAVRFGCLNGASPSSPTRFTIIGECPAGHPCHQTVHDGEAVRIMTGALVPKGADTVVKLEHTREENGDVLCLKNPGFGRGIRFKGDSLKKGETVLVAGSRITPQVVATLASLRRAFVHVHRQPRVAIISTGDELQDFHEPVLPGKTMCSNLYALAAQAMELSARPLCLGIVKDDLSEIHRVLNEALHADVIITSGGTSKGKYDLIRPAFARLGLDIRFSNAREKPGKPTMFGTIGKKLVFGLPGNSTAAMISFDQFVGPALLKLAGHSSRTAGNRGSAEAFAGVDSFNYSHGGNPGHCRAPQVPLPWKCRSTAERTVKPAALVSLS